MKVTPWRLKGTCHRGSHCSPRAWRLQREGAQTQRSGAAESGSAVSPSPRAPSAVSVHHAAPLGVVAEEIRDHLRGRCGSRERTSTSAHIARGQRLRVLVNRK